MAPIYIHSREPDRADRDTPKPQKLTLGSLFDGSGGFPLGGLLSGITPVWPAAMAARQAAVCMPFQCR